MYDLLKLGLRPGIVREGTDYTNLGGWYDGNNMRFRMGFPEKIGGWARATSAAYVGSCRSLLPFADLSGNQLLGVGTNLRYYISMGGGMTNITPIRLTTTPTDPFDTTINSQFVSVTDPGTDVFLNDFVNISGATAVGGITLNGSYQVYSITNSNTYVINAGVTASSTANGGGAPTIKYEIHVGLDTTIPGTGWGAGGYGKSGWGSPFNINTAGQNIRVWSSDTFGEDLVFCARGEGIYYWAHQVPVVARAVLLRSMTGATYAPTAATKILVSSNSEHVIAFGADEFQDNTVFDPMLIRWSSAADAQDWNEASTTNSAGSIRLAHGSRIVTAAQTKSEMIVWTDSSMYSFQFTGAPFIFGQQLINDDTTIIGFNAYTVAEDVLYWMGPASFYRYNGRSEPLPCAVQDYVFGDFNFQETDKVYCGANVAMQEVWWFYCSASSDEVDRYVIYNYLQNIWYYGQLVRTAWVDRGIFSNPLAAGEDGYLYYQEYGFDDGSTNPPSALAAYIESSPIEVGSGQRYIRLARLFPDITFRDSTAASPSAVMTISMVDYQGAAPRTPESGTIVRTATVPVEEYTDQVYLGLRGRRLIYRVDFQNLGVGGRVGASEVEWRTDGRR